MLSLNPRTDLPQFIFDDKFWIPSICQKYDRFLKAKEYPIDDIREVVAESLKSWEIPGLSQNLITQPQFTGDGDLPNDVNIPGYENKRNAQGKTLTLTFRMTDGLINWSCLFEHFWAKLNVEKKLVYSDFPVITRNMYGSKMFTMIFKGAIFESIDGFGVDYSNFDRSYKEFTCTWQLDKFEIDFVPPFQDVKGYDDKSNSVFDIDYDHSEPYICPTPKPSLPK
ncbi:gp127 [Sphingomonas phage PAU]|uniref:gp127 n=1 Tax=Sphingomonas phage PAU TaxID=1150991 RepID=UPI0002573272|nr:gp127 [Sphingomonas phage PAU]AFF28125.1 gp127 [Sphingomonas phage PAU]